MSNILVYLLPLTPNSKPSSYSLSTSNSSPFFSVKLRLLLYQSDIITINTKINYSHQIVASSLSLMSDSHFSRVPVETYENGAVDPSCTEIIVVRHGETDWNALGKLQGQLDVDLNETGRQQAIAVAERLSMEPNISAIYSSDLKRAFETAEMIASKYKNGLEVIRDQDLRERHLGALQGHVYQELAKLTPKAYEAFKSHRSDQEIPVGVVLMYFLNV
ncbi:Phosphoglycerate mutase-like protein 4 [Bienertia sinuspersici]